MKKEKLVNITIVTISIAAIISFLLTLINPDVSQSFLFKDRQDYFMDFFNVVGFSSLKNPYITAIYNGKFYYGSSYPAIAILILRPFTLFADYSILATSFMNTPKWRLLVFSIRSNTLSLISYFIFYFSCLIGCYFLLVNLFKKSIKNLRMLIVVLLLLSLPALYAFDRGNIIILSFLLILIFLNYYQSDNKYLFLLASLSIALATSLKIYPIFFIFLLIKEKKYMETISVGVLAILFIIIPFIFYPNSFSIFNLFLNNLVNFYFGSNSGDILLTIVTLFNIILILINIIVILIINKKEEVLFSIVASFSYITIFTTTYTLIFLIIPFLYFIAIDNNKVKKYYFLYLLIFTPIPFIAYYLHFNYFKLVLYYLSLLTINTFIILENKSLIIKQIKNFPKLVKMKIGAFIQKINDDYIYKKISYMLIIMIILSSLNIFFFLSLNLNYQTVYKSNYSDFFDTIGFSVNISPYNGSNGSSYPPIAHLILKPFSFFVDFSQSVYLEVNSPLWIESIRQVALTVSGQIAIFIYYSVHFILIAYFLFKRMNYQNKYKFLTLLIVIISGPIIVFFGRGNIILTCFLLILIYLDYHQSDNKIKRFIAITCLALACSIKIYPLVFGIFLLRSRRYKEILITGGLTLSFFLIPFLFLNNSWQSFNMYLKNFFDYALANPKEEITISSTISLQNLIAAIYNLLGIKNILSFIIITNILRYCLLIFTIIASYFIKTKWKLLGLLTSLIVLFPSVSFRYILLFYIIALIEYLNSDKSYKNTKIYFILFVIIFNPIQTGSFTLYSLLITIGSLILSVLLIVDAFKDIKESFYCNSWQ